MAQQGEQSGQAVPMEFDAAEFAAQIRHEWDAVAEDWGRDDWRDFVEAAAGPLSDRLIDMARVGDGDRILDLGTGVGEPAARVAERIGPRGRVVGLDLSPRMVEIGNRRLRRLRLDDRVELRVGDAGRPEVPEESFHAALSRWVLMLVPDLPAALGRIRRTLVPGGRLAVGLWGHPTRVPMITVALRLAETMMPEAAQPPPGAPAHLWRHGADAFADLMRQAGFGEVETDRVAVAFAFDSPADYADFIVAMAGPMRVVADSMSPEERAGMMGALQGAVADFAAPDGRIHLVNEVLCIAGSRPLQE